MAEDSPPTPGDVRPSAGPRRSIAGTTGPYAGAVATTSRCRARRAAIAAMSLALAVTTTLTTTDPAAARPDAPSEEDVERSNDKVQKRAAAVDRIEGKLADARARMDDLTQKVQRVVEKYYQEQVELQRARQQYKEAQQRRQAAVKGAEQAEESVAALAAQRYRNGGGLRTVSTVLSADGPQELVDRMNSLRILSRERTATLDTMRASEIVADVLRKQAKKALAQQQQATARVEEAKNAAQQAVERQRAEVERIQRLEDELEQKLSDARSRAERLEQEREDYLEWRREQREARQAAREEAREKAREEAEQAREAAHNATEEAAEVAGASDCADMPVSLGGYSNGLIPPQALCSLPQDGHMLRADAAAAFERLNAAYVEAFGEPICVTDSYRSLAVQQRLAQVKPELAAEPGTSNHGWGVAVDLCGGINDYGTATHEWMRAHAPDYEWVLPSWARADGSMPEPWHWEYTG